MDPYTPAVAFFPALLSASAAAAASSTAPPPPPPRPPPSSASTPQQILPSPANTGRSKAPEQDFNMTDSSIFQTSGVGPHGPGGTRPHAPRPVCLACGERLDRGGRLQTVGKWKVHKNCMWERKKYLSVPEFCKKYNLALPASYVPPPRPPCTVPAKRLLSPPPARNECVAKLQRTQAASSSSPSSSSSSAPSSDHAAVASTLSFSPTPLSLPSRVSFGSDLLLWKYRHENNSSNSCSWESILHDFPFLHGVEVTYRLLAGENGSTGKWTMKREASSTPKQKRIGEWWTEYQTNRKKTMAVVTYLTEVRVPVDSPLIPKSDSYIQHFGPYGLCGLHQYLPLPFRQAVREGCKDLVSGPLAFPYWVLYISPPTHRRISTGPHADGNGYHTALHLVLSSNGNSQNRIQTWNRKQSGLAKDPAEIYQWTTEFCEALRMDQEGGSVSDHDNWTAVVTETDAYIEAVCEEKLEKLSNPISPPSGSSASTSAHRPIEFGTTSHLPQGSGILMPAGLLHHFQKELISPGELLRTVENEKLHRRMSREGEGGPMVGLTGTDVLLGHDEESIQFNIRILEEHTQRIRKFNAEGRLKDPCLNQFRLRRMRVDFPLWLGVLCSHRYPPTLLFTPMHRLHIRTAIPIIERYMQQEERRVELIRTAYGEGGEISSGRVDVWKQANVEGVNQTGILLFCSCVWCGVHIFQQFYYLAKKQVGEKRFKPNEPSSPLTIPKGNYCVDCVSEIWLSNALQVEHHSSLLPLSLLSAEQRFTSRMKSQTGSSCSREDLLKLKQLSVV